MYWCDRCCSVLTEDDTYIGTDLTYDLPARLCNSCGEPVEEKTQPVVQV